MEKSFDWNQKMWVHVISYVTLGKPFNCSEPYAEDQRGHESEI